MVYIPKLTLVETEQAIKKLKDYFETQLVQKFNLLRVSAPLFLESNTGLNDFNEDSEDLKNTVRFTTKTGQHAEIIRSLAKWKRMALYKYEIAENSGIYTDMNAVHPDSEMDEIHSLYVDQWSWEKVIGSNERTRETLELTVQKIYQFLKQTEQFICLEYPQLSPKLPEFIQFITAQELEDLFPSIPPKKREYEIARMYGAVFIIGIDSVLKSGQKHSYKIPDYNDWKLHGELILHHEPLNCPLTIASIGIRVDKQTLEFQLKESQLEHYSSLDFHKMILSDIFPQSIGGGIGQSRICMFFLEKVHIGEVQVSIWTPEIIKSCARQRIFLL
ncbi:MAG: aspartate--ammonia ligase [Brevinemataceae bacterium]